MRCLPTDLPVKILGQVSDAQKNMANGVPYVTPHNVFFAYVKRKERSNIWEK